MKRYSRRRMKCSHSSVQQVNFFGNFSCLPNFLPRQIEILSALSLKGILSWLCRCGLQALCVFGQQATVGGQAAAQDKGPLCTGKNVQRCLRVVRKSAALQRVGRLQISLPSLLQPVRKFTVRYIMDERIQQLYSPGCTSIGSFFNLRLLIYMLYMYVQSV